jgi:negative regulator of flagellin synthesis FlgM
MSDAISNYSRMAQSNATLRSAIDKVDTKSSSAAKAQDEATSQTVEKNSAGADKVSLSNVAQKAMAQPDFDRAKVEAIKQAIKQGSYPINPRRIAESFVALESMISSNA